MAVLFEDCALGLRRERAIFRWVRKSSVDKVDHNSRYSTFYSNFEIRMKCVLSDPISGSIILLVRMGNKVASAKVTSAPANGPPKRGSLDWSTYFSMENVCIR